MRFNAFIFMLIFSAFSFAMNNETFNNHVYLFGQVHKVEDHHIDANPHEEGTENLIVSSQFDNLMSMVKIFRAHGRIDLVTEGVLKNKSLAAEAVQNAKPAILQVMDNIKSLEDFSILENPTDAQRNCLINHGAAMIFKVVADNLMIHNVNYFGSETVFSRPEMVLIYEFEKFKNILSCPNLAELLGSTGGAANELTNIIHTLNAELKAFLNLERSQQIALLTPDNDARLLSMTEVFNFQRFLIVATFIIKNRQVLSLTDEANKDLEELGTTFRNFMEIINYSKTDLRESELARTLIELGENDTEMVLYVTYGRAHKFQPLINSGLKLEPVNQLDLSNEVREIKLSQNIETFIAEISSKFKLEKKNLLFGCRPRS